MLIPSPMGQLEAMVVECHRSSESIVGILCHPHPLYQGTMHHKVITTMAKVCARLNWHSIRFNYRGVGQSDGQYGHVIGEIEDAKAVVHYAKERFPDASICLIGFSFGAYIAANLSSQIESVALVTIAPAVHHMDFTSIKPLCPWLVIAALEDELIPKKDIEDFVHHSQSTLTCQWIPKASHFFHGQLLTLQDRVTEFLQAKV